MLCSFSLLLVFVPPFPFSSPSSPATASPHHTTPSIADGVRPLKWIHTALAQWQAWEANSVRSEATVWVVSVPMQWRPMAGLVNGMIHPRWDLSRQQAVVRTKRTRSWQRVLMRTRRCVGLHLRERRGCLVCQRLMRLRVTRCVSQSSPSLLLRLVYSVRPCAKLEHPFTHPLTTHNTSLLYYKTGELFRRNRCTRRRCDVADAPSRSVECRRRRNGRSFRGNYCAADARLGLYG